MFEFMNVARALSDENRVRIIMALNGKELCVCQVTDLLGLSPSTVSKHLSILRNARLIASRKDGRWMYYKLQNDLKRRLVSDAINWVIRSVGNSSIIKEDQRRLHAILSQDAETKSGQ